MELAQPMRKGALRSTTKTNANVERPLTAVADNKQRCFIASSPVLQKCFHWPGGKYTERLVWRPVP